MVIEGAVISKQSFWDADNKNIFTINTVEVYKVFKGEDVNTLDVITHGGTVGFSNADDGGATYVDALDTQVLTWGDTSITVQIPSVAGNGKIGVTHNDTSFADSSTDLTILYSEINLVSDFLTPGTEYAYQTQHINADGSGGYIWQMQTDFDANTDAKASFIRALDTWRCETGINFTIGSVTTTDSVGTDGVFVVRFDNGGELAAGLLRTCYYFLVQCGSSGIPGSAAVYVSELDIVFDEGTNWNFGTGLPEFTEYDFESVAVHELGHGHQLGHVINTNAIMNMNLSNGEDQRVLGSNDIDGANDIQTRSTTAEVCSQSLMKNYSCPLSIEEETLKSAVKLFPNPSKGTFF